MAIDVRRLAMFTIDVANVPPPPPHWRIAVFDSTAITEEGVGGRAQFSKPTINALRNQGHEVTLYGAFDPYVAAQADVVWTEWCNEDAFAAAASKLCNRLVVRMRGFDVWGPLENFAWENVHALVFESPFLADLFRDHFKRLNLPYPQIATHIIPAGVCLDELAMQVWTPPADNQRVSVALVARAISDKGYQLAFEWARSQPNVMLHVATAMEEHNPRLIHYLEHTAPDNVCMYGAVNTPVWLREVDAKFLLSASIWETLGYTLIEACALGIIPLLHDAPGGDINWPHLPKWRSIAGLKMLLHRGLTTPAQTAFNAMANRRFVELNYDSVAQTEAFAAVLFANLVSNTPEMVPLQGHEAAAFDAAFAADNLPSCIDIISSWRATAQNDVAQVPAFVTAATTLARSFLRESDTQTATGLVYLALVHGPCGVAFTILGQIAEQNNHTANALAWFRLADSLSQGTL